MVGTEKPPVPLLYFPGQWKCKAFPFRSSKKYRVPERGKVRSFLDITGIYVQKLMPTLKSVSADCQQEM